MSPPSFVNGTGDWTRTSTDCSTAPSRRRVYQFHHSGVCNIRLRAPALRLLAHLKIAISKCSLKPPILGGHTKSAQRRASLVIEQTPPEMAGKSLRIRKLG